MRAGPARSRWRLFGSRLTFDYLLPVSPRFAFVKLRGDDSISDYNSYP